MTHEFGKAFGNYEQVKNNSLAMLFDQQLCIGCRACQVACKRWNDREPHDSAEIPELRHVAKGEPIGTAIAESFTNPFELEDKTWLFMRFNEFGEGDTLQWLFTRVSCMHCVEAPCVSGCPTTALWKHPEGPVEVRTDLCIGCRNCIESCPFDVPRINEELGVVEKCTLCADRVANAPETVADFIDVKGLGTYDPKFRIDKGRNPANRHNLLEPACVESCPTDALKWGPRDEIVNLAQKRAAEIGGFTYGIEEAGGTNVIYVLERPPSELGLPRVYKERVSQRQAKQLSQTAGIGLVAAALGLFVGAIRWIGDRKEKIAKSKQ